MPNLVSSALLIGSYAVGRSDPPDVQELAAVAALGALVVAFFRLPSPIRPRGRSRHPRVHVLALTAMAGLLGTTGYAQPVPAASVAQATPEATPTPEPSPTPAPLEVHGLVDVVYAFNTNRPADGANFFLGVGTSGKRGDEFAINLGQVDLTLPTSEERPVGFRLALGFGTGPDVLRAGEVTRPGTRADVWRHVIQASAQYETGLGRGLRLEAGIQPCHIGMEAFASKDNWNYTRSWLGELSPYTQTGLKLSYPLSERWSAQLHVLNGWQGIADNNSGKSVGAQLAYNAEKASVSVNAVAGPELTDNDDDVRVLGDVVAVLRPSPSFSVGVSVDAAREERGEAAAATWFGAGLYARWAPPASKTALALRAEHYDDEDGAISGTPQTLRELTLTLEHRPDSHLIVKLEGRVDDSTAEVFSRRDRGRDGAPLRTDRQYLLLLAAVATF